MAQAVTDAGSLPPFDVHWDNVSTRWQRYLRRFQYFVEGRGIADTKQKRSLLLSVSGEDVMDIVDSFGPLPALEEGQDEFTQLKDKLDEHSLPQFRGLSQGCLEFRTWQMISWFTVPLWKSTRRG